jgi:hypothetical protein
MVKYETPIKEVNHNIGVLYETVLQSNTRLTSSVDNLRVTVNNLMSAEARVKDMIMAHHEIEKKYKILAKAT